MIKLKEWLVLLRFKCKDPKRNFKSFMSYKKMSDLTGLSYAEVRRLTLRKLDDIEHAQTVLHLRRQRGLIRNPEQRSKVRKMTEEMIDFIKDPACVRKWAGLSLAERAALLHRRFPHTRVSGSTIGLYYRKLRIKMKAVAIRKLVSRED